MSNDKKTASAIAQYLLQIKAIKLQPQLPFTWASGWKSPIYCDNRISLSYPEIRTYIRSALAEKIRNQFHGVELIAGVATAAIAQGVLVAQELNLPFVYVRSSPKDHGRENLIEGEIGENKNVVVIEDLVSTGLSSLKAVDALRSAGCKVAGLVSVFNYGFEKARENFSAANCDLHSLCDYFTLLEKALESGYVKEDDMGTLEKWRESPDTWGR
ncbi:MAG: orotate phosphoribosyltransferase [Bacteroidetes bacterium]|nr:MAG: orotate phosphoribosyltransferase [Bacteroidota bacterium]REK00353.1 MAG: orotate phosphoribosyltransferase [Bacteroidota bacterium]REK35472.1 MAG: orotate phosphoribosyltransferase [Bacteroidota bacterium]REK46844.1 MAG: orotate phosphoribosyltransferase [Bacteroidota bacterium]